MTEPRSPVDQAVELVVYAPLGLAVALREELPRLVEKGKQRLAPQVSLARMVGEMAVSKGQKEAGKAVGRAAERLAGLRFAPHAAGRGGAPPAPSPGAAPLWGAEGAGAGAAGAGAAGEERGQGGGVPPAESLAIPGYDSLSAPQVVQRLAGLSADELEAVRSYEAATRHRKTILSRVAQLQGAER